MIALAGTAQAQDLRLASIGDLKIGYRTYGRLAPDKSNAIVVLTWFGGTSEGLAGWIGPGNLYDSSKYYVIVIDALGDGVSSSPSNSKLSQITVRDMVRSQYELLTTLGSRFERVGDQTGGRVFLFLHTDDFWRDFRLLKSRGVAFREVPREEEYGTVAVFEDLYGNLWDLVEFARPG